MAAGLVTGGNLYYALGGGLGHLTRARAVLSTLGVKARVLSPVPHGGDHPVTRGLDLLPVPGEIMKTPAAFGPWLQDVLHDLRPRVLYLDCFPVGLFGELCDIELPPGLRIHLLARLLRWESYSPLLRHGAPRLEKVYLLEPLDAGHLAWLRSNADLLLSLDLTDPPGDIPANISETLQGLPHPWWLLVHSGPRDEIEELLGYARDMAKVEGLTPHLILVTPEIDPALPPDVLQLSPYPARTLYPLVDRIISACGFNMMRETAECREKHRFMPMPRRFDDQFARAARYAALTGR